MPDDSLLCRGCWQALLACTGSHYCPRCGYEVSAYAVVEGTCAHCVDKSFHFDGIIRCGLYTNGLAELVLGLKKDRTELADVLGPLARAAWEGSPWRQRVEILVPVPLHWTRRLARGYNQAYLIAQRLRDSHIRICQALKRVRRTPYQPTMGTSRARHGNVLNAFAFRRASCVKGRRICLVDDITTSGATLSECAKVLKQAGAQEVYALVLAVAGQSLA